MKIDAGSPNDAPSGQKNRATLSDHPIAIARSYYTYRPFEPENQDLFILFLEDEREERRNHNYHRMGVTCKPLPLADIPRHVFPATVRVNEGETITRPDEWI